jgi:hypothetical protein
MREAAVVLGVLVVLGALCGVLWSQVVDPAEYTKLAKGGAMGEDQLGKQFARDGWYAVIALVAGLVAGAALLRWRPRAPLLKAALLVGGSCAAAAVMVGVGHLLGPGDPQPLLAAARVGQKVPQQLRVDTFVVYLAWPFGTLLGALVVLLGPDRGSGPSQRPVAGQSGESAHRNRQAF